MNTWTMSVTILSPPATSHYPTSVMSSCSSGPSPPKKPKLSLNTTNVTPTFPVGKESVSLRLETLSATSPTARNTYQNGYFMNQTLSKPQTPKRPLTPLRTNICFAGLPINPDLPEEATKKDSSDQPSPSTPEVVAAVFSSTPPKIPYELACVINSILINGPFSQSKPRIVRPAHSKRLKSSKRGVSFREPLTENIELSTSIHESDSETVDKQSKISRSYTTRSSFSPPPLQGTKRSFIEDEDDESESFPVTPVAGKRKCDREWVWTLDPISTSSTQTQDEAERWKRIHESEGQV